MNGLNTEFAKGANISGVLSNNPEAAHAANSILGHGQNATKFAQRISEKTGFQR